MVIGCSRFALMSIPEEPEVAYCGKELLDLFTILTRTDDMRAKIRDKRQWPRGVQANWQEQCAK